MRTVLLRLHSSVHDIFWIYGILRCGKTIRLACFTYFFDAARKELKEYYGEEKFASMKSPKTRKAELTAAKNEQYEDYCYARARQRELQTIDANVRSMLGLKEVPEVEETQNRG